MTIYDKLSNVTSCTNYENQRYKLHNYRKKPLSLECLPCFLKITPFAKARKLIKYKFHRVNINRHWLYNTNTLQYTLSHTILDTHVYLPLYF